MNSRAKDFAAGVAAMWLLGGAILAFKAYPLGEGRPAVVRVNAAALIVTTWPVAVLRLERPEPAAESAA